MKENDGEITVQSRPDVAAILSETENKLRKVGLKIAVCVLLDDSKAEQGTLSIAPAWGPAMMVNASNGAGEEVQRRIVQAVGMPILEMRDKAHAMYAAQTSGQIH